jgi:PKD repeat protein
MPDSPQPLDGISAPVPDAPKPLESAPGKPVEASPAAAKPPADPKAAAAIKKWKKILLFGGGLFYVAYACWCLLLLTILPSTDPELKPLVPVGTMSAMVGGVIFLVAGGISFLRISSAKAAAAKVRQRSLIKMVVAVVPGLLLSAAVPFMIVQEPKVGLEIVSPASAADLVAPLSMTFSAEKAVGVLRERGVGVSKYEWDLNGDGKIDQTGVSPRITVNFEREGLYVITAAMTSSDGKVRRITSRFTIRQAVFSIMPSPPIVKKPVVFSVANLVLDKQLLKEVQWDFDDDGKPDETTKDTQVTYTFYQLGPVKVSATIFLTNNTQGTYSRSVIIEDPQPLPFEISIASEPRNLVGPAPFPVLFRVDTKEPLAEIIWNFGDGERDAGARVLHEFKSLGTYLVSARVRAETGTSATVDTIVRVTEDLPLNDLFLDSNVPIAGNRIEGSLPLRLDINPRTAAQFVQFSWEAPDASELGSTDGKLQAVYRKEGTYKITLLAQDVVNRATRRDFSVIVKPQEAVVDFQIVPDTGVAPLTVQLDSSDTSLPPNETPTGYIWKCEANAPEVARGGISSCSYDREGTYEITLKVRTQSGKEYVKTKTIVVRPPVVSACFLPTRSRAKVGQLIGFPLNCSSGGWQTMKVLWDFGDKTQLDWTPGSDDAVHAYTTAGTYTVTLSFIDNTDPSRRFTTTRTVTIEP